MNNQLRTAIQLQRSITDFSGVKSDRHRAFAIDIEIAVIGARWFPDQLVSVKYRAVRKIIRCKADSS